METSAKIIGAGLQRIFAVITLRPLGWNLIDALSNLEEREEAICDVCEDRYRPSSSGEKYPRVTPR
jgi:hypothetical protein